MVSVQGDLLLNSNPKNESSSSHLITIDSNNLLPPMQQHLNQQHDDSSVQNTITKKSSQNPFTNLFHPLHHHLHVHHKQSSNETNTLLEYTSESLLQHTKEGSFHLVKEILDHFATLNHSTSDGNFTKNLTINNTNTITGANASTVYSTLMPNKKAVKLDLEIHDEAKQTPLIITTRNNFTDIASLLIEHGAKVNAKDMDSWTPLLNAAKNGNSRLVSLLIEQKAFIEDKDCGGFTPLTWACYKNHLEVVKILLKNNANLNSQCKNSICCLSWAAGRGHNEIVTELLKHHGLKIDLQDQNSSTPVLWAARKGLLSIVTALIEKGANPDLAGMNNLTPLTIACKNGHTDVALYLSRLPNINVNHIDKDGHTALSISAKNGHTEVVLSLLEKGAYVNIPNKKGDSILITAVKGGHKEIIEALLAKHVEIDAIGNQGKTAMHQAIERGNIEIVRMILSYKPDLEIVAKDGDTLLLLAVKKKNAAIVNELLNSGSKVSPTDKNGDNVLHIALRNKSREITELILSNPKNSKYLYKPNKEGDTPYKIDASNPKSILTQIFGARQLNMSEDSILGYDLYSGALAEILSEPSLHTPITVGLYAKWGSGKSFLLAQLKAEMKSFSKLTRVVNLKINKSLIIIVLFLSLLLTIPFFFWKWPYGLVLFGSVVFFTFFIIGISKYFHEKKEKEWAERLCEKISVQIIRFKLLLRILFLNPFNYKNENIEHKNLRFIFTEYGKISTIGGESALALMISSLNTKMETQLGTIITRLCRVFYNKTHSHSKFRRFCCIPTFIFVIIVLSLILALAIFFRVKGFNIKSFKPEEEAFLFTVIFIILISTVGSSFTWSKILWTLIRSPSHSIMNAVHSKDKQRYQDSKVESYIFKLKREVDLISHTVRTIDAFTHSCTRMVIIIDGLDSCEQSKVLQILEIVHVLFTREGDPFLSILAVDPHVLIKGIEGNLIAAFKNGNVNGHDYLRTIIHLPVYLQVDLSKAKAIAKMPNKLLKRNSTHIGSSQDILAKLGTDVNSGKKNKKNRKRTSTKPMSAIDLTDQLIKSDYFSDVNPRNLRRLINIIALTGRLLRAYHIDFNWRILASWIYLNEQWPYRCSWIVMYYEEHEDEFLEESTLNEVYEKIKHQIPNSNEPLLELDRNARKFEQFIQNCEPKLTCTILKKILPCTCNLDPYLIKLIKESIDANLEKLTHFPINSANNLLSLNTYQNLEHFNQMNNNQLTFTYGNNFSQNRLNLPSPNLSNGPLYVSTSHKEQPATSSDYPTINYNQQNELVHRKSKESNLINLFTPNNEQNFLQIDMTKNLNEMTLGDVCDAISNYIEYISEDFKDVYISLLKEKNINGRVLSSCNLDELKNELKMTFGDWQLFKEWVLTKRSTQKKSNSKDNSKLQNVNSQSLLLKEDSSRRLSELNSKPSSNEQVSPKSPPQTTVITSQLSNHGRKVEFFVTPVIEITPPIKDLSNAEQNVSNNTKKPLNSILVKQNSNQSGSLTSRQSSLKDKHQSTEITILSYDDSVNNNDSPKTDQIQYKDEQSNNIQNQSINSDYDKSENIPLMPKPEDDQEEKEHELNGTNAMTKLGKKLFKSIDNLFHKPAHQTTSTIRNLSSGNDDAETISYINNKGEKEARTDFIKQKPKKNSVSSYEDDEEDDTAENENTENEKTSSNEEDDHMEDKIVQPVKGTKKELIRMGSIKNKLLKVKNQLLSDSNNSTTSKTEVLPTNSSNNKTNTNNASIPSPSSNNTTNNKRKETISNNEEQKTCFIFDDDDDLFAH